MGHNAVWMKFGAFSGPKVRGACPFEAPSAPGEFHVIAAATTAPEGGTYDGVVMYDGTAVTYGFVQWTLTSGRLQRLLGQTAVAMGPTVLHDILDPALRKVGVEFHIGSTTMRDISTGRVLLGKDALRKAFTPPAGATPKTGAAWEKAKAVALAFSRLGEHPQAQPIQLLWYRSELARESLPRRPKLNGKSIASLLYPQGFTCTFRGTSGAWSVARALFWSMWQNSPRQAEAHLWRALGGKPFDGFAISRIATVFARSTFGYWGNAKCANLVDDQGKPKPRKSRYWKVATAINKALDAAVLDPDLR